MADRSILKIVKAIIKDLAPPLLIKTWRKMRNALLRCGGDDQLVKESRILNDLARMPRLEPVSVNLRGKCWSVPDGPSFAGMYHEHFIDDLFHFESSNPTPLFLDCGANVGVVTCFLKEKFPGARIVAFEPDSKCFAALQTNCGGLIGVTCKPAAVWIENGTLEFDAVGADGGHLSDLVLTGNGGTSVTVESVRLRDFLNEPIDFLKLDIEGAEIDVLADCADKLSNVERMFVEYHSFESQSQRLAEFFAILERAGFRVHAHSQMNAPQPFLQLPVYNKKDFRLNVFCQRTPKNVAVGASGNAES